MMAALPGTAPDWGAVLSTWRPTWAVELVATALAALYLRTAVHVGGWPMVRTVSSVGALALAVVAVDSGVGAHAPRSYAVGVVLQVLLGLLVPALWVAGRPVELLRRGSSPPVAATIGRLGGGAVARVLTAPVTVLVLLALVLVLPRVTTVRTAATTSPTLTVIGPLLALGAGLLFFHTALGRARPRLPMLLAGAGIVVLAGLLPAATGLVPTFSADDVQRGGALAPVLGGAVMLVITVGSVAGRRGRRPRSGRCPVC